MVSVVVLPSKAQNVDSVVTIRGETRATRQVDLRAETNGRVISRPLRKGATVRADQPMCEIDPGTRGMSLAEAEARLAESRARVPEAEARVIEAKARLDEALINDRAAEKLSRDGFASEARVASTTAATQTARAGVAAAQSGLQSTLAGIQSAEAAVALAEKEISRLVIHASFDGILESDTAELGSLLQPGGLCATVLQLDPIKLVGFVPEVAVQHVKLGAAAEARLADGRQIFGEVSFISRSADMVTRTFQIEVTVPNKDVSVSAGQTADITISAQGTLAHLLPGSALTLNDSGTLGLRVLGAENTVRFVPITLIRDTKQGVWVAGLPREADVIIVGQEFVTDGVTVDPTYTETAQ
jgi:multidrug efflux system membrane fusion protein